MSEQNLEIVRGLFAAWERGDYSATDWAHPDIEFVMEGDFFPDPGTYLGVDGMIRAWTRWLGAWDGFHAGKPELIGRGERVIALYTVRARGRSSGAAVESPVANVFSFRDGRVARLDLMTREVGLREAGIADG